MSTRIFLAVKAEKIQFSHGMHVVKEILTKKTVFEKTNNFTIDGDNLFSVWLVTGRTTWIKANKKCMYKNRMKMSFIAIKKSLSKIYSYWRGSHESNYSLLFPSTRQADDDGKQIPQSNRFRKYWGGSVESIYYVHDMKTIVFFVTK